MSKICKGTADDNNKCDRWCSECHFYQNEFDDGQYCLDISSLGDHFARLRCTVDIFSQILYDKTVDVGKTCRLFNKIPFILI